MRLAQQPRQWQLLPLQNSSVNGQLLDRVRMCTWCCCSVSHKTSHAGHPLAHCRCLVPSHCLQYSVCVRLAAAEKTDFIQDEFWQSELPTAVHNVDAVLTCMLAAFILHAEPTLCSYLLQLKYSWFTLKQHASPEQGCCHARHCLLRR